MKYPMATYTCPDCAAKACHMLAVMHREECPRNLHAFRARRDAEFKRRLNSVKGHPMNFELRWLVAPRTSTQKPRLQMRQKIPQQCSLCVQAWSDWADVPVVVDGSTPNDSKKE